MWDLFFLIVLIAQTKVSFNSAFIILWFLIFSLFVGCFYRKGPALSYTSQNF